MHSPNFTQCKNVERTLNIICLYVTVGWKHTTRGNLSQCSTRLRIIFVLFIKNHYKESIKIFDLFFSVWFTFLFSTHKARWSILWGLDTTPPTWGGHDMNIYETIKNHLYWGNILGDVQQTSSSKLKRPGSGAWLSDGTLASCGQSHDQAPAHN